MQNRIRVSFFGWSDNPWHQSFEQYDPAIQRCRCYEVAIMQDINGIQRLFLGFVKIG